MAFRIWLLSVGGLILWGGLAPAAERTADASKGRGLIQRTSFGPELRAQPALAPLKVAARSSEREPVLLPPTLIDTPIAFQPPPAPGPAAVPMPSPVGPSPVPQAEAPMPPGAEFSPTLVPVPAEGSAVSLLYPNVKYKDLKNIAPCAVPVIVAVPHPCKPCCCAYVQICVPPHCRPRVECKHHGHEIEYRYGNYEVEIKLKNGMIVVDYDD